MMRNNPSIDLTKSLLFLFLLCTVLLGIFITPAILPHDSFCLFQRITGHDCPGCGLTRAFLLIPRGQWAEAWVFNPAAFLLYGLFLYWIVKIILQGMNVQFVDGKVAKGVEVGLLAVGLVVLLGQWLWKGAHRVICTGNF